ncbi:MAG: hypothetical protein ACTS3F_02365 [Phycisphaerales bacterium]
MSTTTTTSPNRPNDQPVSRIRLGSVAIAIWRNADEKGRVWYSATPDRSYLDADGNWQHTSSFGRDELLLLGKVASLANTRIYELQARDRQAAKYDEIPDVPVNEVGVSDPVESY